jgi:glycosyltransferase involved in cell wall biosynthesis
VTRPPERVALVHDWLTGMRGGEKVLEAIVELYPDATLHTLLHVRGTVSATIEKLRTRCSFVQWLPASAHYYRHYLPVFPTAIEQFDLDAYDLVISTSHCAAKSVVAAGSARHICYCHSPMRYAWDQFSAYFGPDIVGPTWSKWFRPVLARIARWDRDTAGRVDRYVANSHYVAGRIGRYYNRRSTVVHPPVDTDFYRPEPRLEPENRYLVVSALVPYKRVDVAIRACARIRSPLTIVGRGPETDRLKAIAADLRADVTFAGWIDDDEVRDLYRRSRAVVMPGVEDFGMVPVEAQACGRPVVVFAQGGALESVVDGITGIHVTADSADAFAEALSAVSTRSWDSTAIRAHAETFGKARFQREFQAIVDEDGSDAAKYRQDRRYSAAREDEPVSRSAQEDPRDISEERSDHPTDERNAASYGQRRDNPAARENEK